jgi:hypothetical protein
MRVDDPSVDSVAGAEVVPVHDQPLHLAPTLPAGARTQVRQ